MVARHIRRFLEAGRDLRRGLLGPLCRCADRSSLGLVRSLRAHCGRELPRPVAKKARGAAADLGPWTHGDRSLGYAGEVDFGPAAAVDGNLAEDFFALRRRWFDRWLKGRGERRRGRAAGADFRHGRRLRPAQLRQAGSTMAGAGGRPPIGRCRRREWTPYYLHADRSLRRQPPPADAPRSTIASTRAIRRRRSAAP